MSGTYKWTQKMSMHLNGGSEFSQLNHDVYADGEPTGIVRVTRTSGSPKYLKTVDKLCDGSEEFDVLATRGVGMEDWLNARMLARVEAKEQRAESAIEDRDAQETGSERTPPRE